MASKEEKLQVLAGVVERRKRYYDKLKQQEDTPPEKLRLARKLLKRAQRRKLKLFRGRKISHKKDSE